MNVFKIKMGAPRMINQWLIEYMCAELMIQISDVNVDLMMYLCDDTCEWDEQWCNLLIWWCRSVIWTIT